jgi:hypothetical protein
MNKYKPITSPLASHFKLFHDSCSKVDKENDELKNVPYASAQREPRCLMWQQFHPGWREDERD